MPGLKGFHDPSDAFGETVGIRLVAQDRIMPYIVDTLADGVEALEMGERLVLTIGEGFDLFADAVQRLGLLVLTIRQFAHDFGATVDQALGRAKRADE